MMIGISSKGPPLAGEITPPGDKSVSLRALVLGLLAAGESRIEGLLRAEDAGSTADAVRALGAGVQMDENLCRIHGRGIGGLIMPARALDLGNSGTGARLLMGVAATHALRARFVGDASLSARPMRRVITPLIRFGAQIADLDGHMPVIVEGARAPLPQDFAPGVPSAQVKSAILLAALNVPGVTSVREAAPTRDHTERMLRAMGAEVVVEEDAKGRLIRLTGQPELAPLHMRVPGDFSSAAFHIAAALMREGSQVRITGTGLNPGRTGFLDLLREMGASIDISDEAETGGEPAGTITVRAAALKGVVADPALAPRMIDEFPAAFVLAATARGTSRFAGLSELRIKESDRIRTMARGLEAAGVTVRESGDGIEIDGCAGPVPGGCTVATEMDHRVAMSFLVLGLAAGKPIWIDDAAPIATSYPGFTSDLEHLGARIERKDDAA